MSLVVIGTVAFDSVKTPYGVREDALGGSATYFAVAASFFSPVRMLAVVGEDFPQERLEELGRRNIDTSGVTRIPGETFRWKGEYGKDMNEARTLETHLNVLSEFDPVVPENYLDARIVFLANIDPVLQARVRQQVPGAELAAADTMNFWIEGKRDELMSTLQNVDMLVINDGEAKMLAGDSSLPRAARKIREMGPRTVIIKRGEYGVSMFGPEGNFVAPAFPLEDVLDPTGAGDSFAGGMMGYLAQAGTLDDDALRRAMICGSVMASYNVEDFSMDRMWRLTQEEIQERFRQFQELTRFQPMGMPD